MGEEIPFMQQYLTSWLDKKGNSHSVLQEATWMIEIVGCGLYSYRCSMGGALLTGDTLNKDASKVYSLKVSNSLYRLKAKMKNKLISMWDKIMLNIIGWINELLKNKANLVHSRHRSIHNFIMNLCPTLTAYCFFDNKPEALPVYVEKSKLLGLFSY